MKRTFRTISLYGLILGLLLLTACPTAKEAAKAPDTAAVEQSTELPEGVAAQVNGVEIPMAELTKSVNAALGQNPQLRGMVASEEKMAEFQKTVLQKMIETELLAQEGKKLEIADLNTQVDTKIASLKKSFPGEEGFQQALAKQAAALTLTSVTAGDNIDLEGLLHFAVLISDLVTNPAAPATRGCRHECIASEPEPRAISP